MDEIPSHRHWISNADYDDGNMTGTGGGAQYLGLGADAGSYSSDDKIKSYGRYSAWAGGSNGASGKGSSQGNTTSHNNMPPYITVYMWKRTK